MDSLSFFSHLAQGVRTPADLCRAIEELGPIPRYATIETSAGEIHDEKPMREQAQAVYEHARRIAVRLQASFPLLAQIELPRPEGDPWLGLQTVQEWCTRADGALNQSKAHPQGSAHAVPYVEIGLAARTLTVGQKRITPSDRVWEFLKELTAAKQHDLPDLKPKEWKNAVDMLRNKIGKDSLRFAVEFTRDGYKLAENIIVKGGGQMGIRRTRQGR